MIVKMKKLHLIAMAYERDNILNVLQRTSAAEVTTHAEKELTSPLVAEGGELSGYLASLEAALALLTREADRYAKEHKKKLEVVPDGFAVSYSDFMAASDNKQECDALVAQVNKLAEERGALLQEGARLERTLAQARRFAPLTRPFDDFADTAHTKTLLGTADLNAQESLKKAFADIPLAALQIEAREDCILALVTVHRTALAEAESALQAAGFAACPFHGQLTGEQFVRSLEEELTQIKAQIGEIEETFFSLAPHVTKLKIYCDYVGFCLEKEELSEKLRSTERTFLLEAYVPESAEEEVGKALSGASGAVFYEFTEPEEGEHVPTLLKNNTIVKNFETVTNMYSVPNHREFDPNTVMAFFYSLFLGFIMADIGYGLLMLGGGLALYYKFRARGGGIKSLAGVFAVGGVFAVIWGFLFNSLFGMALPMPTLLPNAEKARWTVAGIQIPSVLIIALLIGVVQLFAGYVCRAVQEFRWGRPLDAVFDGITWSLFSVGVALAIVGFVQEFHLPILLVYAGGGIAGVSLLVAVVTAGRREKLLGKFTKGFGSLYSVINYLSDILSYARLYGLMLSGAVIARIVSQYAVGFITGGNVAFAILGVVLMLVGHIANLALGLLGAYIHDARLQYVEFYGRFYRGEGDLFTPLGSRHKYVSVQG